MHIVLGFLTTVVTLLWLLHRLAEMGIDLGGLNPFYWRRRRAWRKKYQGDPIYAVEDPLGVAALFVVGAARLGGELTAEDRNGVLAQFRRVFSLDEREANQLYTASAHLLAAPQLVGDQLDGLTSRHEQRFSGEQLESLFGMVQSVIDHGDPPTTEQAALVNALRDRLQPADAADKAWAGTR